MKMYWSNVIVPLTLLVPISTCYLRVLSNILDGALSVEPTTKSLKYSYNIHFIL